MKKMILLIIVLISSCIPEKEYISIELIKKDDAILHEVLSICPERDSFLYYKLTNNTSESFEITKSLYYPCPTYEPENIVFFKKIEGNNNILKGDGLLTIDLGGKFESDTISSFQSSYFMMKKDVVNEWLSRSPYIIIRLHFVKIVSGKEGYFEVLLQNSPQDIHEVEKADTTLLPKEYIKRNILVG